MIHCHKPCERHREIVAQSFFRNLGNQFLGIFRLPVFVIGFRRVIAGIQNFKNQSIAFFAIFSG